MTIDLISSWISASRKKAGLNQEQLGEQLGVTKANISAWENCRHDPSIYQLVKMVDSLKEPAPKELLELLSLSSALPAVQSSDLTQAEQKLINAYRQADERGRASLIWVAEQCLVKKTSSIAEQVVAIDPETLASSEEVRDKANAGRTV